MATLYRTQEQKIEQWLKKQDIDARFISRWLGRLKSNLHAIPSDDENRRGANIQCFSWNQFSEALGRTGQLPEGVEFTEKQFSALKEDKELPISGSRSQNSQSKYSKNKPKETVLCNVYNRVDESKLENPAELFALKGIPEWKDVKFEKIKNGSGKIIGYKPDNPDLSCRYMKGEEDVLTGDNPKLGTRPKINFSKFDKKSIEFAIRAFRSIGISEFCLDRVADQDKRNLFRDIAEELNVDERLNPHQNDQSKMNMNIKVLYKGKDLLLEEKPAETANLCTGPSQ